jgi:hypothetical protein
MSAKAGWAAVGLLVLVGACVYFASRDREDQNGLQVRAPQQGAPDRGADPQPKDWIDVGGVRRPPQDVAKPAAEPAAEAKPDRDPFDYGTTKSIPADFSPEVKAVADAVRERRNPERYSVLATPPKFDAQAYAANPAAYLTTIEPGRVFHPAQPGKGVKRLGALSASRQRVAQGKSVRLRVGAPPKAPVTFTSFDLGEFSNRLTSITVAADERGVAAVDFFGTSGTVENVNILAASPVTSGQVRFLVYVEWPNLPATPSGAE